MSTPIWRRRYQAKWPDPHRIRPCQLNTRRPRLLPAHPGITATHKPSYLHRPLYVLLLQVVGVSQPLLTCGMNALALTASRCIDFRCLRNWFTASWIPLWRTPNVLPRTTWSMDGIQICIPWPNRTLPCEIFQAWLRKFNPSLTLWHMPFVPCTAVKRS